jgi:hypothetical protein
MLWHLVFHGVGSWCLLNESHRVCLLTSGAALQVRASH